MNADFARVLAEIKKRGFWQIVFFPNDPNESRPEIEELKDIVQKEAVNFRGWDFPHYPPPTRVDAGVAYTDGNHIEAWSRWTIHREIWRFYPDGQFVGLRGMWADWASEDVFWAPDHPYKVEPPGTVLSVESLVGELTEAYEFLSRLAGRGFYESGVRVEVSAKGTERRRLILISPNRLPLWDGYICHSSEIVIPPVKLRNEEIEARGKEAALEGAVYVTKQFNWDRPNVAGIAQIQREILSRRW